MPKIKLHTRVYRELVTQFNNYLVLMGYAKTNTTGVREFLARMEQLGLHRLQAIGPAQIKDHYAYLQQRPSLMQGGSLSAHTINGYLGQIRLLFSWALQGGQIQINPMSGLRFPRPAKVKRLILTKEQIKLLYSTCQEAQERLTLSLYYGCGLRASEGSALNLGDVHLKSMLLYVRQGKGKKRRVIPMTPSIATDIRSYLEQQRAEQISRRTRPEDRQALGLNKIGRRMSSGSYRKVFKDLLVRAELSHQLSLHSLRHSIATHLLEDGMSLERVRDFLGHSYLETTQIYTHLKNEVI